MPYNKNNILQNLKDADCSSDLIVKFLKLEENGRLSEQLRLLSRHRKFLLDKLHINQKQIDCLDYLIFSIEHQTQNKDCNNKR